MMINRSLGWERQLRRNMVPVLVSILIVLPSALAFISIGARRSDTESITDVGKTPVVICPGFGNDQIDYVEPLKQPREVGLVAALERRGFDPNLIRIVPIQRSDWIRVAGGLLDINFYLNKALPTGGGYGWYVERVRETVNQLYQDAGGDETGDNNKVLLIGHSAGGWLARAAMGDGVWNDDGNDVIRTSDRIRSLITVGAIHKPPVDINTCVTRGALAYTSEAYPGAFLAEEGIRYVSVGGDAIVGDNTETEKLQTNADEVYARRGEGSSSRVAYTSYEAVCGSGNVSGDGVVPFEWTQLDGAKQIKLDGVLHSINEAGTTLPTDRWYGSENIIDRWLPLALEEAGIVQTAKSNGFEFDGLQKWAMQLQNVLQQSQR